MSRPDLTPLDLSALPDMDDNELIEWISLIDTYEDEHGEDAANTSVYEALSDALRERQV